MLVTPAGIVTLVSPLQFRNAFAGIEFVHPNSMLLPLPTGPALVKPLQM